MGRLPGVYVSIEPEKIYAPMSKVGGVVGFVGKFVYGEPNKVYEIRGYDDLITKLGGLGTDDAKRLYSILLQRPKGLKVVRIVGSDATTASYTFNDGVNDLLKLEALYPGDYGNEIQVNVSGGVITITYVDSQETFQIGDVQSLVNAINTSSRLVKATFYNEGTIPEGTVSLSGGSDGTITDSEYIGSYDVNTDTRTGMYLFELEPDVEIITLGGTPSVAKNEAIRDFALEHRIIGVVPLTSTTVSNAVSEISTYKTDNGYTITAFPGVKIALPEGEAEVNAAYVLAGILGRIPAYRSCANEVVYGATGLVRGLTPSEIESLMDAKINPIALKGMNYTVRHGLTLTDELRWVQIGVVRVFIYIARKAQELLDTLVGQPNNKVLWGKARDLVSNMLMALAQAGWIKDYAVVCDETVNPPESVEAGYLNVKIFVQPIYVAYYIDVTIQKVLSITPGA